MLVVQEQEADHVPDCSIRSAEAEAEAAVAAAVVAVVAGAVAVVFGPKQSAYNLHTIRGCG